MSSRTSLDKLRLAARILIEWRSPKDSPDYKRVFDEIIRCHPFSEAVSLSHNHAVLELDDRSTILWYLSDSMNRPQSSNRNVPAQVPSDERRIELLSHVLLDDVITMGAVYGPQTTIWPAGPTRARVADAIIYGVMSPLLPFVIFGFASYLATSASFFPPQIRRCIETLVRSFGIRRGLVQRVARAVYTSRISFRYASFVIGAGWFIVAAISLWEIIFNRRSWLIDRFGSGFLNDVLLFVLSGVLAAGVQIFVKADTQSKLLTRAILRVREAILSIQGFITEAQRNVDDFLLALPIFSRAFMDFQAMMQPTPMVDRVRPRSETSDIRYRLALISSRIVPGIGAACGTHGGLLAALVKCRATRSSWGYTALGFTKHASPDAVRPMITLLQSPELDDGTRFEVFRWLCTVDVVSADDVQRSFFKPMLTVL